jgi:protein phosphatase inhibitor 2
MSENLNKKPPKGILKQSSSFDKPGVSACQARSQGTFGSSETINSNRKSTKFDEMNIIETLHPPDKDYGHMKIEEPKTPFNYYEEGEEIEASEAGVDPDVLSKRLETATQEDRLKSAEEESSGEEADDDPEAIAKRQLFESKRKAHYNEYYAVKLARKLLEEEEEEEDDTQEEDSNQSGKGFVPNEELDGN